MLTKSEKCCNCRLRKAGWNGLQVVVIHTYITVHVLDQVVLDACCGFYSDTSLFIWAIYTLFEPSRHVESKAFYSLLQHQRWRRNLSHEAPCSPRLFPPVYFPVSPPVKWKEGLVGGAFSAFSSLQQTLGAGIFQWHPRMFPVCDVTTRICLILALQNVVPVTYHHL